MLLWQMASAVVNKATQSGTSRKEVLKLYRSLLRVSSKWYNDEARKQRLLRNKIKTDVRSRFKAQKTETNPQKVSLKCTRYTVHAKNSKTPGWAYSIK